MHFSFLHSCVLFCLSNTNTFDAFLQADFFLKPLSRWNLVYPIVLGKQSAYYSIIFHWCWSEVAQGLACTHFTETRYQQSYLPKPQVWEWDWTSEILPNTCNTTCSSQRDRGQTLSHLFWNSWCLSWGLAHTRGGRNVWWVDCPSFSHHSAHSNCTATFLWLLK